MMLMLMTCAAADVSDRTVSLYGNGIPVSLFLELKVRSVLNNKQYVPEKKKKKKPVTRSLEDSSLRLRDLHRILKFILQSKA